MRLLVTKIAAAFLCIGTLGMLIILISLLVRMYQGKRLFNFLTAFFCIIFSGILFLGGFIAVDDLKQTNITKNVIEKVTAQKKDIAAENKSNDNPKSNSTKEVNSSSVKNQSDNKKNPETKSNDNSSKNNNTSTKVELSIKDNFESNEKDPLVISKCTLVQINQYQLIAKYQVKNNSNKTIDAYTTTTLMYDGFDEPVMYYMTDSNHINHIHQDYSLSKGQTDENIGSEVLSKTKKIKGIIMKVHFTDGTTWENPRWDTFIKTQEKKY